MSETKNPIKDHLGNEFPSITAMAEYYGIADRTLHGRLAKMSVEEALTRPVAGGRKGECTDHLGNKFSSKNEMCQHYGIPRSIFFGRIGIGWSLKDALTMPIQRQPKNTKRVKDHLGQEFISISAMCKHYNIGRSTYVARIKNGWSVKDALTSKRADIKVTVKKCKDHLGNEYASQNEMCRAYGIEKDRFISRLKLNWSVEKALTEPIVINARECKDGFGHTFPSAKDLCNYYAIPVCYLQGKNQSTDDINMMIRKYYRKNRVLGNITIKKEIVFPYYLIIQDGQEIVAEFDKILDIYHNSSQFTPLPETKIKNKLSAKLIKFPYYKINESEIWSYWDIIQYDKNTNFGMSEKINKEVQKNEFSHIKKL